MMRNEEVLAQYKKFFRVVQNTEKTPVLYHCTAGKDRTGMATVLLLSALGVARPLILKNYLDSNRHLRTKYAGLMQKRPQLTPLLTVRPEYLFLAMESIEEDFLSVENFLVDVMDVDIPLLREKYLY